MALLNQLPIYNIEKKACERLPFKILSLNHLHEKSNEWPTSRPHRHGFYEILYIVKGTGKHFIDFTPYPLKENALYFMSPGQIHFWQLHKDTPPKGYVIIFNEDFLLFSCSNQTMVDEFSFFHNLSNTPELHLTKSQVSVFNNIIKDIENEYKAEQFGQPVMLRAYMQVLLLQVQRFYMDSDKHCHLRKETSLVRRFKRIVSEEFANEKSVNAYARKLNISASHLSSLVKTITGKSPGKIIRKEIVLNAKRMLAHTELTSAEIGYALNFEDPSYFGRFFKRETGMSPSAMRQYIREKCHISFK